jgi:hypothetical protein
MNVGHGKYSYRRDVEWGRRGGGVPRFGVAQGIYGDSRDRVFVFNRSPRPEMMIFDSAGTLLSTWGYGLFGHPHGVWISPRDEVYCTDRDTHLVTKWTLDGRHLRSWGTPGRPGEPGAPFNQPTKAMEAEDGELYVSDGYGQFRMHRFDRSGAHVRSWGEKGDGPSQFALPHDVWVDGDRVLACDREHQRVQVFDRSGDFVSEWRGLKSPMQIVIRDGVLYMAEGRGQISVRNLDGSLIASWEYASVAPRKENAPHSLWVDSRGSVYVGEVTGENGLQKFVRE